MGLNCGCPVAASLPVITIPGCAEGVGQIQKIIFQRVYSAAGAKNTIANPALKASWTVLMSATGNTKTVISPYIQGPTSEPGAPKTFGGGNATLGGIPVIVGAEPTKFSANIFDTAQSVIKKLKTLMCEEIGVYFIDENGKIVAKADSVDTPTTYYPFPIMKFFVGDKKFGGLDEPDSNMMEFNMAQNWSDNLKILTPTDFNPLTDLVNS